VAQASGWQAGKLFCAWGRHFGGHQVTKLNQPLMRSGLLAGKTRCSFLERDRPDRRLKPLENPYLADGRPYGRRIIQNLRAFARQESVPQTVWDVTRVVASAFEADPKPMSGCGGRA